MGLLAEQDATRVSGEVVHDLIGRFEPLGRHDGVADDRVLALVPKRLLALLTGKA